MLKRFRHCVFTIAVEIVELAAHLDGQLVHYFVRPPIYLVTRKVDVLLPIVYQLFVFLQFLNLFVKV